MALAAHRWMMTAPKTPLVRSAFDAVPQAGEVVVEVAGCGVCHTDLGFFYDGVPTRHLLPLTLGHEISGKVVAAGDGAADWVGRTVIVPAVIPCGECGPCRADAPRSAAARCSPATTSTAASHRTSSCRRAGSARSTWRGSPMPGSTLADVSVVADALSTPYQAVARAGVTPGDARRRRRRRRRRRLRRADRDAPSAPRSSRSTSTPTARGDRQARRGAHAERPRARRQGDCKPALGAFAKEHGLPSTEWSSSNAPAPPRARQTAFGLLVHGGDARRRRLHPGQGRGAALEPDGLRRPRARQLGLPAGALPRTRSTSCSTARSLEPFVETHPLERHQPRLRGRPPPRIKRRAVLVPARRGADMTSRCLTAAESRTTTSSTAAPTPGVRYEKRPAQAPDGEPVDGLYNCVDHARQPGAAQLLHHRHGQGRDPRLPRGVERPRRGRRSSSPAPATGRSAPAATPRSTPSTTPGDPEEYRQYMRLFNDMVIAILACDKPVICRVNGMRIGGGQEIGMACDFSVAQDLARFGQAGPQARLGARRRRTDFLPLFVGVERAMESCTLCEPFSRAQGATGWACSPRSCRRSRSTAASSPTRWS